MAQNVYLFPALFRQKLRLVRAVSVDSHLVASGDRFVVIGQALDMDRHRVRLTVEQVIFDPNVVVALIIDERWDLELSTPAPNVIDERWNVALDDPANQFHEELWNVSLSTPSDMFVNELWEN